MEGLGESQGLAEGRGRDNWQGRVPLLQAHSKLVHSSSWEGYLIQLSLLLFTRS